MQYPAAGVGGHPRGRGGDCFGTGFLLQDAIGSERCEAPVPAGLCGRLGLVLSWMRSPGSSERLIQVR
jgi:hypothetical protein